MTGKIVKCERCKGTGTVKEPLSGVPRTCPAYGGSRVQRK